MNTQAHRCYIIRIGTAVYKGRFTTHTFSINCGSILATEKCNPINNNNNKNAYAVWHCRIAELYVLSTWTKATLISWLKTIEISTPYGFGEWERWCSGKTQLRYEFVRQTRVTTFRCVFRNAAKAFISISIFSNRLSCGIHNLVDSNSTLQFEMDEMMHQSRSRSSAPAKYRQRNRV